MGNPACRSRHRCRRVNAVLKAAQARDHIVGQESHRLGFRCQRGRARMHASSPRPEAARAGSCPRRGPRTSVRQALDLLTLHARLEREAELCQFFHRRQLRSPGDAPSSRNGSRLTRPPCLGGVCSLTARWACWLRAVGTHAAFALDRAFQLMGPASLVAGRRDRSLPAGHDNAPAVACASRRPLAGPVVPAPSLRSALIAFHRHVVPRDACQCALCAESTLLATPPLVGEYHVLPRNTSHSNWPASSPTSRSSRPPHSLVELSKRYEMEPQQLICWCRISKWTNCIRLEGAYRPVSPGVNGCRNETSKQALRNKDLTAMKFAFGVR